jgi:SAM-dependent methyltransferase
VNDPASSKGTVPEAGVSATARYYKRDYWNSESAKFDRPWYRVQKSAQLISKLARGRERTLLDIGCGPAALMCLLPPEIDYYGIDIAIQNPGPNFLEADLLESPIAFGDKRFDIVIAQGFFEYMANAQQRKLAEIAQLLHPDGTFIVTYTNFGHHRKQIFSAFSNVQPLGDFRRDLERHFTVERSFPASHNWKHSQPDRKLVQAVNMRVNASIPLISPMLAVDYFFICSPRGSGS